ncbi:hypothetical protein RB8367 [Rhodopirellula baltica SH 1]|uniref:Uncharacterized protein n=1 Tax=Rhodopirellula baltica (strain DSM 10527 / NCIMB 13988 / SH1) TaxID=243090 RepID=Q7UFS6_RHOBA|nr:hypothetical protein RB8367 [Rhodopirellula baltica SH 1]
MNSQESREMRRADSPADFTFGDQTQCTCQPMSGIVEPDQPTDYTPWSSCC